jgi:predicted ATPase
MDNLHILTGAPGSGKTAILDRIGLEIRRVSEPAREILAEQRAIDGAGTHDRDPSLFVDLLLRRSIDKYETAQDGEGPTVFDRGVPDCIAYAVLMEIDPTPSIQAAESYRYNREVPILAPWEDIYSVDEERTMSFADTIAFHAALVEAYERCGYTLVEVPRGSVGNRASFVQDLISGSAQR